MIMLIMVQIVKSFFVSLCVAYYNISDVLCILFTKDTTCPTCPTCPPRPRSVSASEILNACENPEVANMLLNSNIPVMPVVTPSQVVVFTFTLFLIGVCGFIFNRSHIILTLISAELILLAAFLNFVLSSHLLNDPKGQIYALMVLVVAAAESAIGLSLVVNLYSIKKDITISSIRFLKG